VEPRRRLHFQASRSQDELSGGVRPQARTQTSGQLMQVCSEATAGELPWLKLCSARVQMLEAPTLRAPSALGLGNPRLGINIKTRGTRKEDLIVPHVLTWGEYRQRHASGETRDLPDRSASYGCNTGNHRQGKGRFLAADINRTCEQTSRQTHERERTEGQQNPEA
jgi:hypothetical protein